MSTISPSTKARAKFRARSGRRAFPFALAAASVITVSNQASAAPGLPYNGRVSFGEFYSETNGRSDIVGMSDDARYVAYVTTANNLTDEDTNQRFDCFRYDRLLGITLLMSVATNGSAGNGESVRSASNSRMITPDGRYVLFSSLASDLVSGDTNGQADAFIRDTNGFGATTRVSLGAGGAQIAESSFALGMTTDARKILFATRAGLVSSDTNKIPDVYLYDRVAKTIALVSSGTDGVAVGSNTAVLNETGRYVAFTTSRGISAADANQLSDVYWKDLTSNVVKLVSGAVAGVASEFPAISGDGVRVAVVAQSTKLSSIASGVHDVFVMDTNTNIVYRASTTSAGTPVPNAGCDRVSLGGNGHVVAMTCRSADLSPNDTNNHADVLIKDLDANTMTLVSRVANGAYGNGDSGYPILSKDGSQVGFTSAASNLELPDNNSAPDVFVAVRQ